MRGQRQQQKRQRSPRRQMISSELDEHSHRIKELLRADLTMLEEENTLLKVKCKKVGELQDKVQLVLRQNNQLMSQNQKLSRMLHQQKGENQSMRAKFESQLAQKMNSFSDFQYQKKKLLSEIQNLNVELRQLEGIKNMQINEIKTQFQVQYQNLKRQHGSTIEMYQQQIRKFKQLLDKRQAEVNDYANRFKRANSQTQYEIIKLKQQKQKLRSQLNYMQLDHKKDLQDLKHRLDANYLQELQNMKRNHLINLQAIQSQNNKLKHIISERTRQIEDLSNKLNKNKIFFDDSMMILRRQNDNLKMQLIQLQKIGENQKNNMEDKLRYLHQNQLDEITDINKSHIRELENQIMNLQSTNDMKSGEIEQLMRQKMQARNVFNIQSNRLKQQIDIYKMKLNDLEANMGNKIKNLENKLKEQESHNNYLQKLNRQQKNNYESEISTIKEILNQQKNQLDRQRLHHQEVQQNYKQKQNQIQNQRDQIKDNLKRQKLQKEKSIQNLKNQLASTQRDMKAKLEALLSKIAMIQRENQALKKNIVLKDKENKAAIQRLRAGQARERKLELQIDELREKMLKKDQKNNDLISEQKQRLQKSFAYSLENINADHAAAMRLEASKIKQLKDKLSKKDKQLENLMKMYKKMTDEWKALTEQEANKKDINIKFPGASSDLIATKNLFDVFLKTKVLDICGDAIQMKQNIQQKK